MDVIVATLEEFQSGYPVGISFASQIYTDLAWGGLHETQLFQTQYPDDPKHKNFAERERILTRFTAEKNAENRGAIILAGKPCKK